MMLCFAIIFHGAAQSLDHQLLGETTRQAHVYPRIDQRLHEKENIRGSGSRKSRCHVEIIFLLDENFLAQRGKDRARDFLLRLRHRRRCRPNGDALSNLCGSVRHGANDRVVFQPGADLMDARASDNRKHQRVGLNPLKGLHHI